MAVRLAVCIMTLCLSCWIPGNLAYADAAAAPAESAATSMNSAANPAETNQDTGFQISANTIAVANAEPHTSSVQDLSIFGVISLGIMGLVWVRRHTAEL